MNHFIHVVIMRAKATTLIIICLLFLVGTAAALLPDNVAITGNSSWLVAGSGSTATYKVIVTNMSSGVLDADISFSGNDTFGTLKPVTIKTDPNGIASSIFTVGTKSGKAPITVRVQYHNVTDGNYDKTFDIPQNIDHASAYYADLTHKLPFAKLNNFTAWGIPSGDCFPKNTDGSQDRKSVV